MRKCLFGFLLFLFVFGSCQPDNPSLPTGKSRLIFSNATIHNGLELPLYIYRPEKFTLHSPILFVIHGNKRNAETYRNQWIDIAEKENALLVVPEFSRGKGFPEDMNFNMGNLFLMDSLDHILSANPETDWAFSFLDPIFAYIKQISGNRSKGYLIYGHSAGSQFVHRFLYFKPKAKVLRAVCANAGWYTMPDFKQPYPYGLEKTPCTKSDLKALYSKDVIVLLGEADTSQTSSSLRRTPQAMLQGRFRLERGRHFFDISKQMAKRLSAPFSWKIQFVPGARHSNKQMKAAAAVFLFEQTK